ncbi:hypothetical protein HanPSC8_Chr15g0691041 [Helianthus annuus]|nr:hypothetical protein HanPSC8_Chr15g0691041 [Helianthus annuus]
MSFKAFSLRLTRRKPRGETRYMAEAVLINKYKIIYIIYIIKIMKLTNFIISIIKNTHKKDMKRLKLTQKVKNIKNNYQNPLRRSLSQRLSPSETHIQ